ncbi:MAG: tetratricopeptide repeat protein [Chloroflexi bacterium]|nr:tetratricopeptide repeat protein [Chloroflexota bacterium]
MSNEQNIENLPIEERAQLRKQTAAQAVKLAISGRWEEAANLNRELIRVFGDEAEAYNRLGKALTELGQITDARAAYAKSLELEPMNTIARRNLDKLSTMEDKTAAAQPPSQLDTRLFIEETGKSTVTTLQAVEPDRTTLLDAGDLVELRVQGKAVNVHAITGEYVGMVEPRIGLRLAKAMASGNLYTAALVTAGDEIKVMLRETFQHPSMIGKVSFPQAKAATEVRAYTRRSLLRGDETDFTDEDENEEEEREDGWSETGDDTEPAVDVDVEAEDEGFD